MESNPTPVVSEILDDILDAVADFEVSDRARVGSVELNLGWIQSLLGSSIPGEMPPPPPRACFGRGEMIEEIVGFATELTPTALIGAGGIGKTSVALTVLHDDRIKQRFGENRRFIRCDQFPATLSHFLSRLSKVTGAGVENPENLTTLFPFLSSKEMLIVLDNAESILDPQGTESQEIYNAVEELCQLETVCLCITSRLSTIPPDCDTLDVPPLSMESTRDVFYRIYKGHEQSDSVDDTLKQLDGHPLSITLLATVARQNKWSPEGLVKEWGKRQTGVLQTDHKRSLATAIELSLDSPMFRQLGPGARDLLGVVAFYPQGVNENNVDWLFPTVPDGTPIFDKFCNLSLTYRNDGFITMLAPLRDYLRPKDPKSSSLLSTTKESYFARLSSLVSTDPNHPRFRDGQWITSEDTNIEHLLDVLAFTDMDSANIWEACCDFMRHLYWHKKRRTFLGPRVEGLPDDHPSKPDCLIWLARLFQLIGNHVEEKRLFNHALRLRRERGDVIGVARTLRELSNTNRLLGLYKEGIQQAEEVIEISERLGDTDLQLRALDNLTWLLFDDKQLDAAEATALRTFNLAPETGQEHLLCQSHRILGDIYRSKGEKEKAIHHFETALEIASPPNLHIELFWIHYSLAQLFLDELTFGDANTHIERAKSHTVDGTYDMGRAMELQAAVWLFQCRFEDAKSEISRALDIYEKLGAARAVDNCRIGLQVIEQAMENRGAPNNESNQDSSGTGELLEAVLFPSPVNSLRSESPQYGSGH